MINTFTESANITTLKLAALAMRHRFMWREIMQRAEHINALAAQREMADEARNDLARA